MEDRPAKCGNGCGTVNLLKPQLSEITPKTRSIGLRVKDVYEVRKIDESYFVE
jgi:hypothetical protein